MKNLPLKRLVSNVIPVPKPKKDPSIPSSYRPINLLNTTGKILEHILKTRVNNFLTANQILPTEQFGFINNTCTNLQISRAISHIQLKRNLGKASGLLTIDLEKAFDKVEHNILFTKLFNINLPLSIVKLIDNYLLDRSFKVLAEDELSTTKTIKSGVPQGSIQYIYFNIYTHDLPITRQNDIMTCIFADDVAIIASDKKPRNITTKLQTQLNTLDVYLIQNHLNISGDKCELIIFHQTRRKTQDIVLRLNHHHIKPQRHIRYLGVILDTYLKLNEHIKHISRQVNSKYNTIYPIAKSNRLTHKTSGHIYKAYIRPIICYAPPTLLLLNKRNKKTVNILQNKFLRFLTHIRKRQSAKFLLETT